MAISTTPTKPGQAIIIPQKDGTLALQFQGDWYVPESTTSIPKSAIQFDKWLQEHLNVERPELKIPAFVGRIAKEFAPQAEKMYNALIAPGMKCPHETAQDLCCLVMYDLVVLLDDSSTMQFSESGKRRDALTQVMRHICKVYSLARDKGVISVKFFNEPQGRSNYTVGKVENDLMNHTKWKGVTRVGTELKRKILDKFVFDGKNVRPLQKPLLVIVITDGEVEGELKGLLEDVIHQAIDKLGSCPKAGKHSLSIQFAHVGNDPGARALLARLKNTADPVMEGSIDCLLGEKLEHINVEEKTWDLVIHSLSTRSIMSRWGKMIKPMDLVQTTPITESEEADLPDIE